MSETVIEVENISKLYKLGKIGSGSLRQDLFNWLKGSKINMIPPKDNELVNINRQDLWALNNVSFELKEGEALGIIGSNGSGKSTLLKIISRIVQPTTGSVRGKGKVSSILEVGTGFHQDLTGRENIFISGYTLGMNKEEVLRKFDEIVAFSGIEKFIDTPVKRYSSGMYVRLAFAVAAHLEPDILIVDEVLAVGDADFQKKCMGKMQDISGKNGRTILFVSHNMQAITNLCNSAIWLKEGKISGTGIASDVVESYLGSLKQDKNEVNWDDENDAPGNDQVRMKSYQVNPISDKPNAYITVRTPIRLDFEFWCYIDDCDINVNVILLAENGVCVFNMGCPSIKAEKGILVLKTIIPGNLLNNGVYSISMEVVRNVSSTIHEFTNCATIEVEDIRENMSYFGKWPGVVRPEIKSYFNIKL